MRQVGQKDSRANVVMKHNSKKLKGSLTVEVAQQLLPGIPDEITIDLVAPKLPWTALYRLSSVSHAWKQAIQTRQIYDARVRSQSTQTVVAMNHKRGNHVGSIALYSISDNTCYRPPPFPGLDDRGAALPWGYQCISSHGKVYVLGGRTPEVDGKFGEPTAAVYVLDLAAQQKWKQCASMRYPRADFGCGFINGKIYVFGGNSAEKSCVRGFEVYDLESDAWSPIAPIMYCGYRQHVITVGEELVFYNGIVMNKLSSPPEPREIWQLGSIEVYNPLKNKWRSGDHFGEGFQVMTMVGGKVHRLTSHGSEVYDMSANSWKPSQSSSFAIFGRVESFTLNVLAAVAADDELVALVRWNKLYGKYKNETQGTCLLRSKGLGTQNKEIEWYDTQSSWFSDDSINDSLFLSAIEL